MKLIFRDLNRHIVLFACSSGIVAIIIITATILSPNGVILYENNNYIKIIETITLLLSVIGLLLIIVREFMSR